MAVAGFSLALFAASGLQAQTMSGQVQSPKIATDLKLKRSISKVKGLLVSGLANGEFASTASNLVITANQVKGGGGMDLRFSQPVGDSMRRSVTEAIRGLQVKYGGWPQGYEASISFQEKYIPKDGPSAAVACALLLDGLINNIEYDSDFAVTGDLNSDLSVQPIGGVSAKIRGATKAGCKIVAIPYGNARGLADLYVKGDLEAIAGIQIFTIKTFEDASKLANKKRDADLKFAIDEFAKVQQAIAKSGITASRNPAVQQRLGAIVEKAPNHQSARLLLLAGQGKGPKIYSLAGSFNEMNIAAAPFLAAIGKGGLGQKMADKTYGDALFQMREIRPKLDERTRGYHDAMTDLVAFWREWGEKDTKGRSKAKEGERKFKEALVRLQSEQAALQSNKEIADELME